VGELRSNEETTRCQKSFSHTLTFANQSALFPGPAFEASSAHRADELRVIVELHMAPEASASLLEVLAAHVAAVQLTLVGVHQPLVTLCNSNLVQSHRDKSGV
jgi:hypothetical protein